MGLFFKISDKKLLEIRNEIFVKKGIPELEKNGFKRSPFSTSWYGRNNLKDFTYELCRLQGTGELQIVKTHIVRGDKSIQVFLNIFELKPALNSLSDLNGLDGIKYGIPPNVTTRMQLRVDDYNGFQLLFYKQHKIGSLHSQNGLKGRIRQLEDLIAEDLRNIDYFIERWYELHKPKVTDWEGGPISSSQ